MFLAMIKQNKARLLSKKVLCIRVYHQFIISVHPASYPMGTRGSSFPWGKAARM